MFGHTMDTLAKRAVSYCVTHTRPYTESSVSWLVRMVDLVWQFLFALFIKVFPRPKLANEEVQRSASVVGDFFAIEIIYTVIDFACNMTAFTYLGIQNYVLYTAMMVLIRHHAVRGRLKLAAVLYGASVIYFYLLVVADMGFFEHLQAANTIIVIAYATITMGPRSGFIALTISLALFWALRAASASGLLTPLIVQLPGYGGHYNQEWLVITTQLVEMFLFCWLCRSHIFSQLSNSIQRERENATNAMIARNAADKAESEKTRFLASASHDLRQPVTSLLLNFENHAAAHPELASDPAFRDMGNSIASLNKMLESILTVSKLDAKVLTPVVSAVDLDYLLQRCLANNGAAARQKGLALRTRRTSLWCDTDPEMLFRVLNNIINNAVKYTQTGGILFGVRRIHGGHALYVLDTGVGIPKESLDSIFDEFTMLTDTSRKSGTGLGLAIVRRMVALLGLKIHTLSEVGVGTSFYIELPETYARSRGAPQSVEWSLGTFDVPAEETHVPVDAPGGVAPPTVDLSGLVVAVCDDVEDVRYTICRTLEAKGMKTIEAGNIPELEQRVKGVHVDVLITDYKLEDGVTGYDVILTMRNLVSASLPCFIITGDTSPVLVQEMAAKGVTVYYKPVGTKDLLDAIRKHSAVTTG